MSVNDAHIVVRSMTSSSTTRMAARDVIGSSAFLTTARAGAAASSLAAAVSAAVRARTAVFAAVAARLSPGGRRLTEHRPHRADEGWKVHDESVKVAVT